MTDFVGHISNCLINGDSFSDINGIKIKNTINLFLANKSISIIQSPDLIIDKINMAEYQNKFVQSTKILIKNVNNEIKKQLAGLSTKNVIKRSIKNLKMIFMTDMKFCGGCSIF